MQQGQYDQIVGIVEEFNSRVRKALDLRLEPWPAEATSRQRQEMCASALMHFANVATALEDGVAQLAIIYGHLQIQWDAIAAPELAKPRADQYMPAKGRIANAMLTHHLLYDAMERTRVSVDVGKRAVERVSRLQDAASRAAGLAMPVH